VQNIAASTRLTNIGLTVFPSWLMQWMLKIAIKLLIAFIGVAAIANAAYVPDPKSKELSNCVDILSYATNAYMLANNQGAAKLMLFQQARAATALMSMHYEDGVVKGERMTAFAANRDFNRKYLDGHPSDVPALVDNCVATASKAANEQSARRILMWGKSYSELVQEMVTKMQGQLGLR
jgi:hypothetical protein